MLNHQDWHIAVNDKNITASATKAADFLIKKQTTEGFWHDYDLVVGSSRAWTTAYVAKALTGFAADALCIKKACKALLRIKSESGWGYNLVTSEDADTISFCLRFLNAANDKVQPETAKSLLQPFIENNGNVKTFSGIQFGSWSTEHLDVAASVGLALAECAEEELTELIAQRIHKHIVDNDRLNSFWWVSPVYTPSITLEFFSQWDKKHNFSKAAARHFRSSVFSLKSVMDKALFIKAEYYAAQINGEKLHTDKLKKIIKEIIVCQNPDGSWNPSAIMKIPRQSAYDPDFTLAPDLYRLMTTATAMESIMLISNQQ
ncbi:MAG: hypothetical protein LRY47_12125 [Seleniivibrio sp.]|nr:hypothetical protein [Seleniivibrio sp.]